MAIVFANCKQSMDSKYQDLITIIEKGDSQEIAKILWQPKTNEVNYNSSTISLILKLKKPDETSLKLSVFETHSNENYTLLIFNWPWSKDDLPYYPIIIEKSSNRIVGIMHPFNDLHFVLTESESKQIRDVGTKWLEFVVLERFGKTIKN